MTVVENPNPLGPYVSLAVIVVVFCFCIAKTVYHLRWALYHYRQVRAFERLIKHLEEEKRR